MFGYRRMPIPNPSRKREGDKKAKATKQTGKKIPFPPAGRAKDGFLLPFS